MYCYESHWCGEAVNTNTDAVPILHASCTSTPVCVCVCVCLSSVYAVCMYTVDTCTEVELVFRCVFLFRI